MGDCCSKEAEVPATTSGGTRSSAAKSGTAAEPRRNVPKENSTSGKSFSDLYRMGKQLGEGAFSTVKDGTHKQSGESFAIKIVTKAKLTQEDEEALKDEISVLNELKHQHIIRLYDVFDENQYYYLVTEKMSGGELFDRIVQKSYYNEKEARDTCRILFEALRYCHAHKVAHRDLKPENLLLCSEHNDSDIKIADFGFAKKCLQPSSLTTQCGTPGYVAPEILEGVPYDMKSDMWSLGVIVYILLGGYPPFIEQNQRDLFRKIRKGQYEFHEEYWGQVSSDAKELISSLLTVSPARRLSASEALRNKWIMGDDAKLAGKDLGKNLKEFKRFNAKRKFKGAVKAVIASNKITSLGTSHHVRYRAARKSEAQGFSRGSTSNKRSKRSKKRSKAPNDKKLTPPEKIQKGEAAESKKDSEKRGSDEKSPQKGHFDSDGWFVFDTPIQLSKILREAPSEKGSAAIKERKFPKPPVPGHFNSDGWFMLDEPLQVRLHTIRGEDGKLYRCLLDGKGKIAGKTEIKSEDT